MTVGSQLKQTLVGLKGASATMRLYAEQGQHDDFRSAFHEAIVVMDDIVADMESRLRELEFAEPQYKGL